MKNEREVPIVPAKCYGCDRSITPTPKNTKHCLDNHRRPDDNKGCRFYKNTGTSMDILPGFADAVRENIEMKGEVWKKK